MKMAAKLLFYAVFIGANHAANPIEKVLQMCDDLLGKLNTEASKAERIYNELKLNCDDRAANLEHEIDVGSSSIEELNAAIEDNAAQIESGTTKVEELVASIAQAEKELKAATSLREEENAAFVKKERDLVENADMLTRAHSIIKREMSKGSFVQVGGQNSVLNALKTLVDAETISLDDANKLTAMLQQKTHSGEEDDDADAGSPDAAVYESKSGGVLDAIDDMAAKVSEELDESRKAETDSQHNFELLKQSLSDQIKNDGEDKQATEDNNLEQAGEKANNEGELKKQQSQLADNKDSLSKLQQKCSTAAETFDEESSSRAEEIKAVTKAKKIIAETTSGAAGQNYGFLELSAASAPSDVLHMIKKLARSQDSSSLAQLASRMQSAIRLAGGTSDVFAKVKGLITEMITRLETEQEEADAHNAYCVKETSKNDAKVDKTQRSIDKLTARKDSREAKLAQLKQSIKDLAKEIVTLEQQMIKSRGIREEENNLYIQTKSDNELGISGVQQALKVLRDYYAKGGAHQKSDGASSGIINLLEVALEDFQEGLATATAVEEKAAADFDKSIKAAEVAKASAEAEKKGKEEMIQTVENDILNLGNELGSAHEELDALLKYRASLKAECEVVPESYEERAAKRKAELDGLKTALDILEKAASASLVQTRAHRSLRR